MAGIKDQWAKKSLLGAFVMVVSMIGLAATASANPIVLFDTSFGSFEVELNPAAAPQTVANFLKYVNAGEYSNTIIHRSVNQPGFAIIQGGGYSAASTPYPPAPPHIDTSLTSPPLPLESALPNSIGTIAMARTSVPNSGTSEYFFNVIDDSAALAPGASGGYTVFGQVLGNGLSVLQAINALTTLNGYFPGYGGGPTDPSNLLGPMPLVNFDPQTAEEIDASNLVIVRGVSVVPEPSTIVLATLGGLALVACGRRRGSRG